jgi:hypothetical protein
MDLIEDLNKRRMKRVRRMVQDIFQSEVTALGHAILREWDASLIRIEPIVYQLGLSERGMFTAKSYRYDAANKSRCLISSDQYSYEQCIGQSLQVTISYFSFLSPKHFELNYEGGCACDTIWPIFFSASLFFLISIIVRSLSTYAGPPALLLVAHSRRYVNDRQVWT